MVSDDLVNYKSDYSIVGRPPYGVFEVSGLGVRSISDWVFEVGRFWCSKYSGFYSYDFFPAEPTTTAT